MKDFWTGDVSGLYTVKPAGGGPEIRLIQESLAYADAKPILALPGGTISKASYRYHALDRDRNLKGAEAEYKRDTDKSARKVHNLEIFGFCAFPENEACWEVRFRGQRMEYDLSGTQREALDDLAK